MPIVRHSNSQREGRHGTSADSIAHATRLITDFNSRHPYAYKGPSPSPYSSSRSPSVSRSTPASFESKSEPSTDKASLPKKPRTQSALQSQAQSHARKREEGYIKRPSNAFILFRTDFVTQGRIPSSLESHSQNLSRIAGEVWKSMSDEEKAPWKQKADEVKAEHRRMFPGYEYHPTDSFALRGRRRVMKGRGERELGEAKRKCMVVAQLVVDGVHGRRLERVISEIEKSQEETKSGAEEEGRKVERKIIIDKTLAPHRKFYVDEDGRLEPVLRPQSCYGLPPPPVIREEDKWRLFHAIDQLPPGEIRDANASPRTHSVPRTLDETTSTSSVSPSAHPYSLPSPDARGFFPQSLFSLPNTYIPPGHELETEFWTSWDPFASAAPSTRSRSPQLDGIRNQTPEPESCSGAKVTLPSIVPPPDAEVLPDEYGRAPKLALEDGGYATMPSRKFPGALHVPDKPRSSRATPIAADREPTTLNASDAVRDRSLLYTCGSGGGSHSASTSGLRNYDSGSSSLVSSKYALLSASTYEGVTEPGHHNTALPGGSSDSTQSRSVLERQKEFFVRPDESISEVLARRRKAGKPEIREYDRDPSAVVRPKRRRAVRSD